jgi:small subunit ribosomal protein S17
MPKKVLKGKVVSDKMQKTVVVAVDVDKKHPIYNKAIRNTRRYKVRDEKGVEVGDIVLIEETRPYSKEVTWKVIEVLEEK